MALFAHPMPELPDVTVYVEHLERRLKGAALRKVLVSWWQAVSDGRRVISPFQRKLVFSLDFDQGSVLLTEASPKKRAWIRVVSGREALEAPPHGEERKVISSAPERPASPPGSPARRLSD